MCIPVRHAEWHMRKRLAPILFNEDDPEAAQPQPTSQSFPNLIFDNPEIQLLAEHLMDRRRRLSVELDFRGDRQPSVETGPCPKRAPRSFGVRPKATPNPTIREFTVELGRLAGFRPSKHLLLPGIPKLWSAWTDFVPMMFLYRDFRTYGMDDELTWEIDRIRPPHRLDRLPSGKLL